MAGWPSTGAANGVPFAIGTMRFLILLLLYSAVLYVAWYFLGGSIPEAYRYPHVRSLFLFFMVLMLAFNVFLSRPVTRPTALVTRYLGATVFKFLLCLGVLAVVVLWRRPEAIAFTLHFMTLYFCYTVFEVAYLYNAFKRGYPARRSTDA